MGATLKDLYNALKADGRFSEPKDFGTFASKMNERGYSSMVYNTVKNAGADVPDIATFRKNLGVHVWKQGEGKKNVRVKPTSTVGKAAQSVEQERWGNATQSPSAVAESDILPTKEKPKEVSSTSSMPQGRGPLLPTKEKSEEDNVRYPELSDDSSALVRGMALSYVADQENKPTSYTKPGALVSMEKRRQKRTGNIFEEEGRYYANEERERLDTPAFDVRNEGANEHIVKTQGQLEKEMRNSADLLANDKSVSNYLSNAIFGEFKNADKRALQISQGMTGAGTSGSEMGLGIARSMLENQQKDPEKLLKNLQEKTRKSVSALFSTPEMREQIEEEAMRLGISTDAYIQNALAPKLQERLAEEFDTAQLERYLPKGTAEYITTGINDSLIGTLSQMLTMNKSQRVYMQRANAMTAEGLNHNMEKPGMWTNAARGAVSFAADAPIFGLLNPVGGKLAAKMFGNGVAQTARAANMSWYGRMGYMAGSAAVNQGTTGLLYGGLNSAVQNFSTGDDTSFANTMKTILSGGVSEGASWATMGAFGGIVGGGLYKAGWNGSGKNLFWNGAAKVGSDVLKLGAEGVGMHLGGNVAKTVRGEDTNWFSTEGILEDCANVVALKLSHAHKFLGKVAGVGREKGEDGKRESYTDFVARNLANYFASDAAKGKRFKFTEEEKKELFDADYTPERNKALIGFDKDDNPEYRFEGLVRWALRTKGKKPTDRDKAYDDTDTAIKSVYERIMSDENISWDAKAKYNALVMGTMPSVRPMMDYWNVATNGEKRVVEERAKDGTLLSRTTFDTAETREAIAFRLLANKEQQRTENAYFGLWGKDMDNKSIQEEYMRSLGYDFENPNNPRNKVIEESMAKAREDFDNGVEDPEGANNIYKGWLDFAFEHGALAELQKRFCEERGMSFSEVYEVNNKEPWERTDEEHQLMLDFRRALEKALFPEDTVHEEQSQLGGKDVAEENGLGSETPNGDAVKATLSELRQAEEEVRTLMDENEVFKSEYERLQEYGLSNAQIYQELINNGMTQEELLPFAKYINANAKVQGMVDGTQKRIEQNVHSRVMEWGYKGELNGEKQSGENIVYVTDSKGRVLVVASGDVAFDAEGKPKEDVGDMLVVYDVATGEMDFVSARDVTFRNTESAEEFGARYAQYLQELNSQAYVEAQQGEENGKPQQEGAKPQEQESGEETIVNDGKGGIDKNGNILNSDGSIYTEKANSVDDISDEDFNEPSRSVELPQVPTNVSTALGSEGKPIIIKKNIFEKNLSNHPELEPEDSRAILNEALYNPTLIGQTQPTKRPSYKVAVRTGDKNSIVVLDVYADKKQIEIVGWRRINEKGLAKMQRQAEREGGQFLILSPNNGSAAALSALPHGSSSLHKDSNSSSESGENKQTLTFADGTPVPMTTDSKGRQTGDLTKMSPEHGAEYLETTLGEVADEFVDGKIKASEKAVDKAKKQKVDMSGDAADVQEAIAKKNEAIGKAEAELAMYTGIKKAMTEKKISEGKSNGASESRSTSLPEEGGGSEQTGSLAVARAKFEGGQRVVGNKRTRTLADGTKIRGHYELVEAESLTPSHDATDGYKKSEGFPVNEEGRTMNDRDYEHDKDAQRVTDMIAKNYDGQAVDQVPVVTEDGIVVDGNGRTMAGQKAAKDGTDGAYLDALKENAENYGFTVEQIDGMKHPRLVLVSDDKIAYDTATFAKFNRNEKKAQGNTQQAIANSKKLTSDEISVIVSEVEGAGSLDAFFNNPVATNSLLKRLIDKGVIGLNEVAALREGNGKLSAQGKDFVKNLLLGSVFSEDTIRMMGEESVLKTKALNGIRAVIENMKLGEYALTSEIDKAIQLLYDARQKGVGVDALLRTPAMFGENAADRYDPISQAIALALEGKAEDFRELMLAYNKNAEHYADPKQLEMFGEKPTKEAFVKEFLKLIDWKDYETRHSSEEGTGDAGGSKGVKQEARGGSEEEGQREIAESVKNLATEITKQVGEGLVVTDDKEAERVIKESETAIDGNKLRFQIKTPEQRKAAENAYNWAQQNRPSGLETYAVVDMSRPDAIPQYFEKKDLAKHFKKYWSIINNGEYKLVNLDKTFEENIKGFTGEVPEEFNPSGMKFHKESDAETLERLEKEPKAKVYRAMQVIDGKLYPPMAAAVDGKLVEANELGVWIRADENPDLAIPDVDPKTGKQKVDPKTGELKWKFKLDKGGKDATGKKATSVNAAYNPYWHTSRSPLNDQFKSAWIRPNIVIVECEVPESELTSGYKAERAKDAVGEVDWKSGSVSGEIYKQTGRARKVILSRWCKPVRVLSDAEFAQKAKEYIGDADVEIPENVVTPKQRVELEKLGVKIGSPEKGVNKSEQISEALGKGLLVDNSLNEAGVAKRMEFRTKDGEVYGFTDGKKIYLDTKKMKPETPLHEYTHLWGAALRRVNTKEWENVKGLLDKVDGLKTEIQKLYPELKGDDLYDEMLAMFSGREGTKKLEDVCRKLAAEEGKTVTDSAKEQGFIDKVKEALQKFWKATADLLHIHFTSAEDVADKVLTDWARGFDPRKEGANDGEPSEEGKSLFEQFKKDSPEDDISESQRKSMRRFAEKILGSAWAETNDYPTYNAKRTSVGIQAHKLFQSERNWFGVGTEAIAFHDDEHACSYEFVVHKDAQGHLKSISVIKYHDFKAEANKPSEEDERKKIVELRKAYEAALDHEEDVEQEWADKILDYVFEHYPTQATISGETKSERGLREREAMRNDPVLKKMREDEKREYDKARKASSAAFRELSIVDGDLKFHKAEADDVETTAKEHGVDATWLARYAEGMKEKNSAAAYNALYNLKASYLREHTAEKKALMEREGVNGLIANKRLLEPIEEAIKAKYGDVDVLIEERRKQAEIERGVMEAARKRAEKEQRKREARLEELAALTDEDIDKRYAEALEKGDEATAREMLDEAARRKGYGDAESDYQGVGAWGAPSKPDYESDEARRNAVGEDSPNLNVEDMAAGYNNQPEDIFVHPKKYSQGLPTSEESGKVIQAAIDDIRSGKKGVKIKVYRAVPTSVKEGKLRNGDWVTPNRKYAEMHGENRLEGKYRIIEDEVPVNELWWDSNDVNEWGYDNGKSYRYKNAKNNRKLNDLVTRDDKGNVIPPSKRFNSRKADERYHKAESEQAKADKREQTLRDEVVGTMRKAGLDVSMDTEEGQRVLDEVNGKVRSMSFGEPYDYETYPLGRVEPNLAEKEVGVVKTEANHGFSNYKEAKAWAKEQVAKIYNNEETGGKGDVRISNGAIDKFLSQSAVDKSDTKDVHMAVLKVLPDVLKTSIDVETHPDFLKGEDGKRRAENGMNKDVLVHRCYGAVSINGKPYRVKITLKENVRTRETTHTHSYEATKIELLAGQHGDVTMTSPRNSNNSMGYDKSSAGTLVKPEGDTPNTNNSISAAKLLENVGMSYNPSEKVLDASEKRSNNIREHRVYHGSGADFDRFDHSHMGEGEGAQVFGWGTYVTEVEGIGRTYAEQNSKKFDNPVVQKMVAHMQNMMAEGKTFEEAKSEALERMRATYEKVKGRDGYGSFTADYEKLKGMTESEFQNRHLYTVEIPDDTGENYLEWSGIVKDKQAWKASEALAEYPKEACRYMWENPGMFGLSDSDLLAIHDNPEKIGKEELTRLLFGNLGGLYNGKSLYQKMKAILGSDKKASLTLNEVGFTGIKYPADFMRGGREDGKQNYVIFNEGDAKITDHVRFFRTANGEAYGYTIGGKIYIDPRIANAETPIHEYAHLWATALRRGNAEEWKNVVGLMKGTKVWDEVKKKYPELKADEDIADEVLATYSGRRGAERLRKEMNGADGEAKGALARVKQALQKFWKATADLLHIHFTSAEDVADRVMKDLLDGVDPRKIADPMKGMERAAEKYREEQRLKLQKKNGEEDEMFVSLQNKKGKEYYDTVTELARRISEGKARIERLGYASEHQQPTGYIEAVGYLLSGRVGDMEVFSGDARAQAESGWDKASEWSRWKACVEKAGDASSTERGSISGVGEDTESFRRKVEELQERTYKSVEKWAANNGCLYNDADIKKASLDGKPIGEGCEAIVYRSNDGNRVVKTTHLDSFFANPLIRTLDKVQCFNDVFPESAYTIKGYGRDANNSFSVVMEQPYFEGKTILEHLDDDYEKANDWLDDYQKKIGFNFDHEDEWGNPIWSNGKYTLLDLNCENVIIDKDGIPHVIDCEVLPIGYEKMDSLKISDTASSSSLEGIEETNVHYRINKEKALTWLGALRNHRGTELTEQELSDAAKVVNGFDISKQKAVNYRIGEYSQPREQSASAAHIAKAIEKTARQTGGKVKQIHSVEEIANEKVRKDIEDGKEVTGWYDEKTGEVHLYMPNIHDTYTAEKTVWHETVGHKGMRGLLGDKFHTYLRSLWMDMDNPVFEELHKYVKERMAREPMSMYDAIEEFVAEAAEKGKGEAGFWNNIRNKVAEALRSVGYRLCPNVKDVKYMLWLAKNVQKHGNDPVWKMRAEAAKWKIEHEKTEYTTTEGGEIRSVDGKAHGFESMTKAEWDEATDGQVHYRTSPSAATAIDRYHRMLGAHGYMAIESFADNMASVERLMRALDPKIKKIEDVSAAMNPYMLRTVLDGTASEKMQRFEADVMQPLDKYMARLIDAVDGKNDTEKIRNFNLYMIKKHGLERNRVFFVRDAVKNMDEKKRKQTLADFNTKRKALGAQLRGGNLMLSQYYTQLDEWICNNVNKNYKAGEHDYSGMHGLYGIADKKSPYDDIQVQDEVMSAERAMEGMERGSVEKFWGQVKVATQYSLDEDYKNGFVTKANHESVSEMFDWYVPLRKFDEATAEDVYGYVTELGDSKTAIGPAIVKAKGRKSLSETNILAQIGAMANYAVVRGSQNKLKQAFALFVRNKGGQGLVTETKAWIEQVGTDMNGNPIWQEVFPDIQEGDTADDIAAKVEAFEQDMKQKEAQGLAKNLTDRGDIGFKFERKADKSQHYVDVMIAGKTHRFVINGNPRAAQALNGQLENSAVTNKIKGMVKSVTRFMAQMATSYNPEFVMRNAVRDAGFALQNVTAKEGARYGAIWAGYYAKMLPVGASKMHIGDMKGSVGWGLYAKYRNGKLDMNNETEKWFKEFMENGGETGFVQIKNMQQWEKQYKRDILRERSLTAKSAKALKDFFIGNVENVNEVVENMARFAAYCASRKVGRSIQRCAYDAKQVSVNFNRHGSGDAISSFETPDMGKGKQVRRGIYGFTAGYLRNYSMFFNAGVQGTQLMFSNVKKAPIATIGTLMVTPFAFGMGMAMLNAMLIGYEDEKERGGVKDPYAELPEYIRRNNLCIYLGEGKFATIPLAIEHRAFYGFGDIVAGLTTSPRLRNERNAAVDMMGCLSQLFPVVDFTNSAQFDKHPILETVKGVLPTAVAPFAEWLMNSDWKGAPIRRVGDYTENRPSWKNAYSSTPERLIALNKWANAMTNDVAPGNPNMKGADWADALTDPSMLNHIIGTLGGGATTTTMRALNAAEKGRETEWNELPILRNFGYVPQERTSMMRTKSRWYNYVEEMNKTIANYNELDNKNVPIDERIANIAARFKFENSDEYRKVDIVKRTEKQLKRMRKLRNRTLEDKAVTNGIDQQIDLLIQDAVERLDEYGK